MHPIFSRITENRENSWILADGATGTCLFERGLLSGDAPELWNVSKPNEIKQLHTDFIQAGSDLILTNTFGCNACRLKLHHADDQVYALNKSAAKLARQAVDNSGKNVLVAGSIGPTGELLDPLGILTAVEAVKIFEQQIEGLRDGGADFMWGETFSSLEELHALAEACLNMTVPFSLCMSFDTAGHTMMGVSPVNFLKSFSDHSKTQLLALGINCGTGSSDLMLELCAMAQANIGIPLIAKGNAGIPKFSDGAIVYNSSADMMAEYAKLCLDAGATIIGGCCGTKPTHIAAMQEALVSHSPRGIPQYDQIISALGQPTQSRVG
jgi:5-methyltetrahydrofolate--homocysteine methyltransferase